MTIDLVALVIAIILCIYIILRTLPLIKSSNKPMTVALFLFAIISLLFSITYWLVYTLISPDVRMPFAANELGEASWFLLLAATLDSIFKDNDTSANKEIFFSVIFIICSVSLWIAWSGEWFQDIISGFAFGYFICLSVKSIKQSNAFKRNDWLILGLSCLILIISQAGIFFVKEEFKKPLDLFCYALMFITLIWFLSKVIIAMKKQVDTKELISLSFIFTAYSFSTLYMSSGWFYIAAFGACLLSLPLMFYALRRELSL